MFLSDSGAQFRCAITNSQGSTNSTIATLTVLADTVPPTISSVGNLGDSTLLTVLFSEPVEAATANDRLNYTINNGVNVSGAALAVELLEQQRRLEERVRLLERLFYGA